MNSLKVFNEFFSFKNILLHLSNIICVIPSLQDNRLVPGAGATEIELAKQITSYGEVRKFNSTENEPGSN